MTDKKTVPMKENLGTASPNEAALEALYSRLRPKDLHERFFFRPRQTPQTGPNGEIIYTVSPVDSDAENQSLQLVIPSKALEDKIKKYGCVDLKAAYYEDLETPGRFVLSDVEVPDDSSFIIKRTSPKGLCEVDLSGAFSKMGVLLEYNCEHGLLDRFNNIIGLDAPATEALLKEAKAKEYLLSKVDSETNLKKLFEHHGITEAELAEFYQERTEGKTLEEILGANLSQPIIVNGQEIKKLGANIDRAPGSLHTAVESAAMANRTLTKEIALKYAVARQTMDALIDAGKEHVLEDGAIAPSDAEKAFQSYVIEGESPFPAEAGLLPKPNAYGEDSAPTISAMPAFGGKGGKTKFNNMTEEAGQQLYSLMNAFQLDLGNQFINPSVYPATVLDKSLLFTAEGSPNEEGRKALSAESLVDPLQLEMLDRAAAKEGKTDFKTVLETRQTEVSEIISTDQSVIDERLGNDQFSAVQEVKNAVINANFKAGLDVPEDNSKAVIGLAAIAFGMGLNCLKEALDDMERNHGMFDGCVGWH